MQDYYLTTKPHDEHHLWRNLVISEKVQQERQRENVDCSAKKNQDLHREAQKSNTLNPTQLTPTFCAGLCIKTTYNAPNDKGYFKVMWEAEDGEAKKSKHTSLCGQKLKIVTENVK